jgi:DNA-directed RNA polymerase specialized sigma subunit
MSGRANIYEMYYWHNHNEPSKYQDIQEFVKYHEYDDRLLEFEAKLEKQGIEYLIYKYRFKENKTFKEISELLDMEGPRISEKLDKIAFALRIYCRI